MKTNNIKIYRREVLILSTNKLTSLFLSDDKKTISSTDMNVVSNNGIHLYILSDEEIKEGDWFYTGKHIRQCEKDDLNSLGCTSFTGVAFLFIQPHFKKIIATTDKYLAIRPYISFPKPSPQFIQKFVKEWNNGNKIEWIDVEYEKKCVNLPCHKHPNGLFINILKVDSNNNIIIKETKNSWSREEVIQLCLKMQHEYPKFCSESHYQPNLKEIAEWTDNWIDNNL